MRLPTRWAINRPSGLILGVRVCWNRLTLQFLARPRVPHLRRRVPLASDDPRAVRAERHTVTMPRVPLQIEQGVPVPRPKPLRHQLAMAASDDLRSVWAERHAPNTLAGAPSGQARAPPSRVPHLHPPVMNSPRGDDPRAVRAERHAPATTPGGRLQLQQRRAVRGVPHLRRPVITAGDDPRAVRAERPRSPPRSCALSVRAGASRVRVSHTFAVSRS